MTKQEAKQRYLERMKSSAERLIRLINLNAPGLFLAEEVMRLWQRGMMAFPEEMGEVFVKIQTRGYRARFHLCQTDDCPERERGVSPYPHLCSTHLQEQLEFEKELEADLAKDKEENKEPDKDPPDLKN